MNFWFLVIKTVICSPLKTMRALFWLVQGKKLRARNKLGVHLTHIQQYYDKWQKTTEKSLIHDILNWSDTAHEKATIEIVPHDTFPQGNSEYILFRSPFDQLSPYAILAFEKVIAENPDADIIFSDSDLRSSKNKRCYPYFKGAFNPTLYHHQNYLKSACVIKTKVMQKTRAGLSIKYDDLYGVILNNHPSLKISHLPFVTHHFKDIEGLKASYFNLTPFEQKVALDFEEINTAKSDQPSPLASILIPTRDMLALTKQCVESILNKTTYTNYEILILDNDSQKEETLSWFNAIETHPQIRIISCPGPFNYSAINNRGANLADGEYICLLNNDTKVITPDWLEQLLKYASKPKTGAVGAKLLYEDHTIQHAGVLIGSNGLAGHSHRFLSKDSPGYFNLAHLPQQVMAVTAACLLISKKKYQKVGGLNETDFKVAFNDVDLCLKLDKTGFENIYTPYAKLFHFESKSRGKDLKGEKKKRFESEIKALHEKWGTNHSMDRFYSEYLTQQREDFALAVCDKEEADNVS